MIEAIAAEKYIEDQQILNKVVADESLKQDPVKLDLSLALRSESDL